MLHPRSKEHERTQRLGSGQGPSWCRSCHGIPSPTCKCRSVRGSGCSLRNQPCLLIEVKNFIGTISLQDGDIIQYKGSKPRNDSKEILPLIKRKASDLRRWGASLFGNASLEVVHLVVLSNPQAELEYNVLNHPHVATLKTLEAKVSYLLQSHPELHRSEIASVQTMAEMFGTWDTLETEAGLVVNGDIIDTDLPDGWTRGTSPALRLKSSVANENAAPGTKDFGHGSTGAMERLKPSSPDRR